MSSALKKVLWPQNAVCGGIVRHAWPCHNVLTNKQGVIKRHLFSSEILGIENFKRQQEVYKQRFGELRDTFRTRMEEYMASTDKNTIFTDDLKTMVHISENESDLSTLVKMIKLYETQRSSLKFTNFIFGPIVMRLLHVLQMPAVSLELFNDPDLATFFDQMSSYVLLMDLLFESEQYGDVLDIMEIIKQRQLGGFKFPMDCITLTMAACLKLNTEESYKVMLDLLKQITDAGSTLSSRSMVYAAVLAVKQGHPEIAFEILTTTNDARPTIATENVRLMVLTDLDRLDDVMQQLRSYIQTDVPDHVARGGEVFQSVLEHIQDAVNKADKPELVKQFTDMSSSLNNGAHVSPLDFDEYIFRPVVRQRRYQDGFKQRSRTNVGESMRRRNSSNQQR